MLSEKEDERVMVFIDGSNLYHILKVLVQNKKPNDLNFEKFIKHLTENRTLIKTYYYNAPLDLTRNLGNYMKQQRFFEKLQKIHNFQLVLCRMQKVKIDGKIVYQVKEDDIHLAVDMVKLAYNNAYDTAILVSSDGDFVPAIDVVKERGKRVENVGFENKFSYHLKQRCDRCRILKKQEVEQFFDLEKKKTRGGKK
jgi:uncharacterized LabA/DUF88 family protein